MNGWKNAYVSAVDAFLALGIVKVTNEVLQTKIESMNPAYRVGSQGPSDFAGIRNADGSITRKNGRTGSISGWRLNYPVLFIASGNEYELLPVAMRVLAVTGNSAPVVAKTKAELLAELAALELAAKAKQDAAKAEAAKVPTGKPEPAKPATK